MPLPLHRGYRPTVTARWLRLGTPRNKVLRDDLMFSLVIVPVLMAVLVAFGADRDRVLAYGLPWMVLGVVFAVVRFSVRNRSEQLRE